MNADNQPSTDRAFQRTKEIISTTLPTPVDRVETSEGGMSGSSSASTNFHSQSWSSSLKLTSEDVTKNTNLVVKILAL